MNKKIKILAIKFETVDGKKTGKSFSFEMAETHPSHYDLLRFLDAQEFVYTQALRELKKGRKRGHRIWYIFPQQKGLGHSHNANYYGWMERARREPTWSTPSWATDSVSVARLFCCTRTRT